MSRRVLRRFAAVACVLGIVLALGSCSLGFLGGTITLSGPLYYADKEGLLPSPGSGTIDFGSTSPDVVLTTATVTSGAFSVELGVPATTAAWSSILPPIGLTISDPTAQGFVINDIMFHRSDPIADIRAEYANETLTTLVYLSYTDKDVDISGSGTYTGPAGGTASDTCIMDFSLKAGWNSIVMTRAGPAGVGPYTDTYKNGGVPSDVFWTYGF
jgi:hypothetical protein